MSHPHTVDKRLESQSNAEIPRIDLTSTAAKKIKEALRTSSASGLKIKALKDEQGRLAYDLTLEKTATNDDLIVRQRGIAIYVNRASAESLDNSSVDYVRTTNGPGFLIRRLGGCGCGPDCGCSKG